MGFLASEIRSQKWIEKQAECIAFLKENKVSNDALIYEMELSKKVYKTLAEAVEYIEGKYLSSENYEETEESFIFKTLNWSQVDLTTAVEIEIRRGVTAKAADLIRYNPETYNFSDKGVIFSGCKLASIDFSEDKKDLPQVIEIARVVEGEHPTYGKINITKEHLKSFVANFNDKVTGTDLAINEDHKKNEAFGWYKDVFLNEDGDILYGTVNWNAKGTRALSEKEYRYFSPEFRFNYVHPHSGKEFGATLLGGALTNYPFLKMEAITELSEKTNSNKGKAMPTDVIALSEHTKTVMDLNSKITEINGKLDAALAQNVELSNKVKASEEKAAKIEREATHQKLFNEGKINAAQLVALNEGKSMLEVIALNEPMNTTAAGKGNGNAGGKYTVELSEDDKATMKALNLTEEEYRTANKIL